MKYLLETNKIETDLIEHNKISVDQLFELYTTLHFIYPQKEARLKPVLNVVRRNWIKAMKADFPLFWVSTVRNNILATGSAWQHTNTGMIAQHLASNHPVGSRIIFLGMLCKVIENQYKGFIDSYQIYYRPQNKYSSRVFESLSCRAGEHLSEIIPYHYFEFPALKEDISGDVKVIEIKHAIDEDILNFLLAFRSKLFIKAQELDSDDVNLEELDSKFQPYGLKRKRKFYVAILNGKIAGFLIMNQSSLGFNFSFFENSSELILSKDLNEKFLLDVAGALMYKAFRQISYLPLGYMPVLIDPFHSAVLEKLNGKLTRNYNLFMMLKGGYEIWYDHINEVTNTVFQRFINNTYGSLVTY
jgi:hypothetical protein